jgi:uncharacterized protein (UPF0335 family)
MLTENTQTADELIDEEQARVDQEKAEKPELDLEPKDVGGVAGQRLRSFIERVERIREEKAALNEDEKEVWAEMKGIGYHVPTGKKIVKLRAMDSEKRREEDELLDLYKSAIGMV